MKHDELERQIIEAARDYNEPPAPPREEMWATIRESLPSADRSGNGSADVRRLYRWTPWALGLAAAAALVVGFGLGRITGPAPAPPPVAEADAPEAAASLAARLAAADHLGEAEAMLTLFRSTDRSEERMATASWARNLLGTTRMMMDSRLAEDPEMAELLADLELVLVQIAGAAADPSEHDLIEDGIQERQLMTKLRSAASPVGAAL
jgi:hypothetical protein